MTSRLRMTMKGPVNRVLGSAGLYVGTTDGRAHETARRFELARQIYDVYSQVVLPDLKPRDGRVSYLADLHGTQVSEAMFLLRWLQDALAVEGDVCEFGVAQGATSALLAHEIEASTKHLWLYDSFAGLPSPTVEDVLIDDVFELGSMDAYTGAMRNSIDGVRTRLARTDLPMSRVHVVAGFVTAETPASALPDRISFAYVDFDLYAPISAALRLVDPRTTVGSVVMVDDYRFLSSGVEQAVHEFLADRAGRYELVEGPEYAGHFCMLRRTG